MQTDKILSENETRPLANTVNTVNNRSESAAVSNTIYPHT